VTALVESDHEEPARSEIAISHTHIPPQTLLPPASVRLVRVDITRPVSRVGT